MGLLGKLFGSKKPDKVKLASNPEIKGKVSGPEEAVVKYYNRKKDMGLWLLPLARMHLSIDHPPRRRNFD